MERKTTQRPTTDRIPTPGTGVIELGIASRDTKGPPGGGPDSFGQLINNGGLEHD